MNVDVAAIRAALGVATPGPWEWTPDDMSDADLILQLGTVADDRGLSLCVACFYGMDHIKSHPPSQADAALIVLLRNNAEALLRMLDDGYCAGYDHGVEDQMDRQEAALAEAERRGAVNALRAAADELSDSYRYSDDGEDWDRSGLVESRADAIEKGAAF